MRFNSFQYYRDSKRSRKKIWFPAKHLTRAADKCGAVEAVVCACCRFWWRIFTLFKHSFDVATLTTWFDSPQFESMPTCSIDTYSLHCPGSTLGHHRNNMGLCSRRTNCTFPVHQGQAFWSERLSHCRSAIPANTLQPNSHRGNWLSSIDFFIADFLLLFFFITMFSCFAER